jgi:hypothetical protein
LPAFWRCNVIEVMREPIATELSSGAQRAGLFEEMGRAPHDRDPAFRPHQTGGSLIQRYDTRVASADDQ